jgi:pimeloyl-ACP methyl ester carboxylesterase
VDPGCAKRISMRPFGPWGNLPIAFMPDLPSIARIWRGRTRRDVADVYEPYLRREGIPPLEQTALGVQLFREDRETETEFTTISYWPDVAAMADFTGGDPHTVHHLPRDGEFLLELPDRVHIARILLERRPADPAGRRAPTRQRLRLSGGTELSFVTAGDASMPAVLLLHGFPGSARSFRAVVPALSRAAYVIAPELPGFGESDVLPAPSFAAFGQAVAELLDRLAIGARYIYLHDFGAPVGFHLALQAPQQVSGLIIQNANAHQTGLGPPWVPVQDYWSNPNSKNEAAATAHLTFEGVRQGVIGGAPPEVAERIPPESWEEEWRVMNLPGRMDTQRALVRDYGNYVARFDEIAAYIARWQPPALMLWGRHDVFFDLAETLSWMRELPRMEAHIFDAGHKLLETHSAAAVPLMLDFIGRVTPT